METNILFWCPHPTFRSYPTYEEWKPSFTSFLFSFIFCSYPTYEEWKPFSTSPSSSSCSSVLILPMRNGNKATAWISGSFQSFVLILPMRNGNIYFDAYSSAPNSVLILPMRNGNHINFHRSYENILLRVLILPMRNGNPVSFLGCLLD